MIFVEKMCWWLGRCVGGSGDKICAFSIAATTLRSVGMKFDVIGSRQQAEIYIYISAPH